MHDNGRPGAAPAANGRGLSGDEHPRRRLLCNGPESLSNAELLAVLFRTGRPGTSALDSAHDVLRRIGGLIGLINSDLARRIHEAEVRLELLREMSR